MIMKNKVLEFTTEFNGEDKTRELREFFALVRENNGTPEYPTFVIMPTNKGVLAKGMLPEDLETLYGDTGIVGVLPWDGLENVIILGNGFTIYHEEKVIPKQTFYQIDDNGNQKVRSHHNKSDLSFVRTTNCKNIDVYEFHIESWNREEGDEKGYPVWDSFHEFEAGFEISNNCENLYFERCNVSFTGGDGYEISGKHGVKNITIYNPYLYFIGRQGCSPWSGTNILLHGIKGEGFRRALVDAEPADTKDAGYVVKNLIVRECSGKPHLLPFPMGGGGVIDCALYEDNEYYTMTPTTIIKPGKHGSRSNITFRRNKMLKDENGLKNGIYQAWGVKGLKIEEEILKLDIADSRILASLVGCENVIIKNNSAVNARYIKVNNCLNVVASGNSEPLNWLGDKEGAIMESEAPFEVLEPDFEPYMGFGLKEVPVQPEPTPEQPTEPTPEIKTPEEAVSAMEKILEFLKKQNGI